MQPFFSICIPVYKNIKYLDRLLQSIRIQTFNDYEVVVSDDSPDDTVEQFLKMNYADIPLAYYRNTKALGTPANWNFAIEKATGTWIKLIHDDDWFASEDSLLLFSKAVAHSPAKFFHCNYSNVLLSNIAMSSQKIEGAAWRKKLIYSHPEALYARNIIGPPSVTLVHHTVKAIYDTRMKWLVDIDFYMAVLRKEQANYIPELLIKVGLGDEQVTQYTHNHPEIEIPEGLLLHSKLGDPAFKTWLYYDAWWRLMRNLKIRSLEQLSAFSNDLTISGVLVKMLQHQSVLPLSLLQIGPFSKASMFISWRLQLFAGRFK